MQAVEAGGDSIVHRNPRDTPCHKHAADELNRTGHTVHHARSMLSITLSQPHSLFVPGPGCEPLTIHDLTQRQRAGSMGTGVPDAAGPAG